MLKMKWMNKKAAAVLLSVMILMGHGTTAWAYVDPAAEETTQVEVTVETPSEEPLPEETEELEPVIEETPINREDPFTEPGNGQLQDDFTDSESKEFLTITTKNNNTFYVIIDRSATTDNVYMLSQIDENDLKKFLDEEEMTEPEVVTPAVVIEEPQPQVPETEPEPVQPEQKTDSGMGLLIGILAVALAGAGIYGYMKFIKPKNDDDDYDNEGMEMPDASDVREDSESDDFDD